MAFTIAEAFLPATLNAPPMTDEQFADFCSEHPDLFFEMSAEGELIVKPPNYALTSCRQRAILTQLDKREVEIYRANGEVELLKDPQTLQGEGAVQGVTLNLLPVWDPLGK